MNSNNAAAAERAEQDTVSYSVVNHIAPKSATA